MSNSFLNPVTTQTWANGRHIVRCVKVIQETWDVRTFCFMADQPILFFFKPGQFVTLELEIEGSRSCVRTPFPARRRCRTASR
jgi:NAD(P)H-flavin reductase